ncbi:MAG TPA: zf-HC2 domain-containing protein [Chloroflexi bacterium]|nr:zf-HC2 domain-containing protein [Chloroflexota bacterium]
MMAHDPYALMISLSLDGLLDAEEEEDLHRHVQNCPTCAGVWRDMSTLDRVLNSSGELAPPPNFTLGVMARIESYETQRRLSPWFALFAVMIMLSAVVSVGAPIALFVSGLYRRLFELPFLGSWLSFGLHMVSLIQSSIRIALGTVIDWLTLLTADPAALAVVISALVLASTWIGLLEGMKAAPARSRSPR